MHACCSELAPKSPVNGFLRTILAAIALDDPDDLQRDRPPKHDVFRFLDEAGGGPPESWPNRRKRAYQ
jgi:hypothetical protein